MITAIHDATTDLIAREIDAQVGGSFVVTLRFFEVDPGTNLSGAALCDRIAASIGDKELREHWCRRAPENGVALLVCMLARAGTYDEPEDRVPRVPSARRRTEKLFAELGPVREAWSNGHWIQDGQVRSPGWFIGRSRPCQGPRVTWGWCLWEDAVIACSGSTGRAARGEEQGPP